VRQGHAQFKIYVSGSEMQSPGCFNRFRPFLPRIEIMNRLIGLAAIALPCGAERAPEYP